MGRLTARRLRMGSHPDPGLRCLDDADRPVPRAAGRALGRGPHLARVIASLQEEAEAIGWYEQRISIEANDEARSIMEHTQREEFLHFSMDLEFLLDARRSGGSPSRRSSSRKGHRRARGAGRGRGRGLAAAATRNGWRGDLTSAKRRVDLRPLPSMHYAASSLFSCSRLAGRRMHSESAVPTARLPRFVTARSSSRASA